MHAECDALVAGAGPAGAAVALGLAQLGHHVIVLAGARTGNACEGVSDRVLGALHAAGLEHAAASGAEPVPRHAEWGGEQQRVNRERLLWRGNFDRALLEDLEAAGIEVRRERLRSAGQHGAVTSNGDAIRARLLVDARGRSAPRGRGASMSGPPTVSLAQRYRGAAAEAGTGVSAFADGWAWFAYHPDGNGWAQLTLAADMPGLPKRAGLASWLWQRLLRLPQADAWLRDCRPHGAPVARASTTTLSGDLVRNGVVRVGDAAMAVDPLSGNGIFQALSSASVAPAVINTLLREPENAALATRFYTDRVRHVFLRFARTGRDFYRAEQRWAELAFWGARAAWPDEVPAHADTPRVIAIEPRPVVEHGFIREREVVITSEQPLGVWRMAGVELAPLLRGLPQEPTRRIAVLEVRLQLAAGEDDVLRQALLQWCVKHGL